jgi:dihydroflavonol-4-reductase
MNGKEAGRSDLAVVVGMGHLGINLVKALTDEGRSVRVLDYDKAPTNPNYLKGLTIEKVFYGDVSNRESLLKAFEGAGVVYNTSAHISLRGGWEKLHEVNVVGVGNVIRAANEKGVPKVICFSSIHAIEQKPVDKPLDETRPLVQMVKNPSYGHSKAEGERLARKLIIEDGLVDGCILAPTGMIGPMDYVPSEFGKVLLKMTRRNLLALVDAGMDWVDVRDVAKAALMAEKKATTGEKIILSGHFVQMRETAKIVEMMTGQPAPRVDLPMWAARTAALLNLARAEIFHRKALFTPYSMEALTGNQMISHQHATEVLGFEPRPHKETVEDAVEWLLRH